jgi:cytochrome P450
MQGIGMWTRPLPWLERNRALYGHTFTVKFPFSPTFVMFSRPEDIKTIFTAPADVLHPGEGARVLQPVVGVNSVLLLDGGAHMEQRKLMLPAFHGDRMERLGGLVEEVTTEEVAAWGGGEAELHPRFQALTLEVILRAVFGVDPGPRMDSFREQMGRFLAYGESPLTLIPPPKNPEREEALMAFFNKRGPTKGFATLRDSIDALIFELIAERRQSEEERDDVLAMLLEARHEDDGSPMSDQEIRDELMTLLVAGHETTATTLAWAFERIARESRVLARLRDELDDPEGAYVTAAIQETMRHRPVLPNAAPRLVKKPIEVGGRTYEPGVALIANTYLLHHDPAIYEDPYEFRPERFLDNAPGTYTWIPFGGGRRRCLGASFAMLEMRMVLPAVLRAYEIEADGPAEPAVRRNITLRPGRGARVALAARQAVAA